MAYKISAKAAADLFDILRYGVAHHGLPIAEAYYRGLVDAFAFLSTYRQAARERTEIVPPVRVHPCKSHLIVYEILDDDIVILRVRHGREDWMRSG